MNTAEVLNKIRRNDLDEDFYKRLLEDVEGEIEKAEKQISMMEDAIMIYHMQRAPTRRAWYVSVGNCRGDRAKWIIDDFRKGMAEVLDNNDASKREDIFFPRYPDEINNTCVEDLDTPTTWDGSALLETLYHKRERLLTLYCRLLDAISTHETGLIVKAICEISSWRLR